MKNERKLIVATGLGVLIGSVIGAISGNIPLWVSIGIITSTSLILGFSRVNPEDQSVK